MRRIGISLVNFISIMTQFFFSPTSDFFTEDLVSHKMHKDSFPVAGRKECMFCDSSAKHGREWTFDEKYSQTGFWAVSFWSCE